VQILSNARSEKIEKLYPLQINSLSKVDLFQLIASFVVLCLRYINSVIMSEVALW